jgi:hypothetical protein
MPNRRLVIPVFLGLFRLTSQWHRSSSYSARKKSSAPLNSVAPSQSKVSVQARFPMMYLQLKLVKAITIDIIANRH